MRKLNCLIIDDEPNAVALLSSYVEKVSYLNLSHASYDALDALAYLRENPIDLIFLDIEMQGINGMELAGMVHHDIMIIFTTAYSKYAVESYEKNAVDYLLKPITFRRFMQSVTKASEKMKYPEEGPPESAISIHADSVFFKSGRTLINVLYHSILFFEGKKEYVQVVTETEKLLVYKRMKELEQELPSTFLRIHHSYIINMKHIKKVEDNHVWIYNRQLPISEKYRGDFLAAIK